MARRELKKNHTWFYWVSIGIVLIVVFKLLDNYGQIAAWFGKLIGIVGPFLWAILISYVLYAPCRFFERVLTKKMKEHQKLARGISIAIVYIIALVAIALIIRFVVPGIWSTLKDLVNNATIYFYSINNNEFDIPWLSNWKVVGPWIQENILKPLVDFINGIDLSEMVTPDKIFNYIISTIGIVRAILNIIVSIVCSIYIMGERKEIVSFLSKWVKSATTSKVYSKVKKYFVNGSEIFFTFLTTQLLDGIIIGTILSIIFVIMKVKYGIVLGEMIGLFNLIPFFGPIVGVIIAVLITILTGGWKQAIILGIVAIIVSQIDSNLINPKLTGNRLKISPLLVIVAVTIGGAYFGPLGMFLAVPIATLIKAIIDDNIKERLEAKKLEGSEPHGGKRFISKEKIKKSEKSMNTKDVNEKRIATETKEKEAEVKEETKEVQNK